MSRRVGYIALRPDLWRSGGYAIIAQVGAFLPIRTVTARGLPRVTAVEAQGAHRKEFSVRKIKMLTVTLMILGLAFVGTAPAHADTSVFVGEKGYGAWGHSSGSDLQACINTWGGTYARVHFTNEAFGRCTWAAPSTTMAARLGRATPAGSSTGSVTASTAALIGSSAHSLAEPGVSTEELISPASRTG